VESIEKEEHVETEHSDSGQTIETRDLKSGKISSFIYPLT
jgi:hypothetical protein